MKTLLSALFFACCSLIVTAQDIDLDHFENMSARSIGPAGMSGRVTCIAVNPTDKKHIFVGTASGGVWHSGDGGVSWNPIFDDQPILAIGSIAIHPKNPDLIWVGTGEGNPRNSHNAGAGVFKSMDGGKSWQYMGLKETKLIHRVLLDPNDMNIAYLAALGSAWGPNKERGVYKTTDGGKTWSNILYVNDETGIGDMVMDPRNPLKLIAATWEFGRKPWTFNSGGEGSGLHITYDGGENWKKLSSEEGLPKGQLGRIGLAISESSPNVVYALVEAKENAFYRSMDGGETWKKRATDANIGNRPFYYADIFVDPSNENRIYSIHSTITRSEDGGASFQSFVPWQEVHPDHHALWIDPENPDYMINGNDGGMAISYDRGENWRFVENLPVGQFYHINYDMDIPYNVYGGMQDNGSWIGPSSIWKRGGIRNADWRELYFGDGFDVVPRRDNNRFGFAMSQGGNVGYYDKETGEVKFSKPVHPEGQALRFNWNAAIAQDPFNDCGIYFGSQFVHRSMDCGQNWEILSPDLTSNDSTKQKQAESGGLTIDATQAENHTTILAIAPSPFNKDVIFVGTDDGNLQMTNDGGQNWTNISSRLMGAPKGAWIPHIEIASEKDIYVSVNNYRNNDYRAYAFHSADGGMTFRRIADDAQIDGHVMCVVQDPVEKNLLFLGSDVGLYFSLNAGRNWQKFTNGMPPASVRDLKIHPREHDLIIGTFGRANYILDNIRPLRALASNGGKMADKLKVFNPGTAYISSMRSVDGTRFVASGMFVGDNKGPIPRIPVWLEPKEEKKEMPVEEKSKKGKRKKGKKDLAEEPMPKKDKKEKKKKKDPEMFVLNAEGDTIRHLKPKLKEGLNYLYWGLEEDGISMPSRRKRDDDAPPPYGLDAMPGNYTVVVKKGELVGQTNIEVKIDPRSSATNEDLLAVRSAQEDFNGIIETATETYDGIREVSDAIKTIKGLYDVYPEEMQDSIKSRVKEIEKEYKDLDKIFFSPAGQKGIDSVTKRLNGYLWTARRYIGSSHSSPTTTALAAIAEAQREVDSAKDMVDTFYSEKWDLFKEFINSQEINIFEE